MRGIPKNPVTCHKCGNQTGCPKDSLCHRCRIRGRPNSNKKFHWNLALDEALRRAYKTAGNRNELTQNLNHVQRLSGFSRFVIQAHATELGLSFCVKRSWSEAELCYLREKLGSASITTLARRLGRTYYSVKAQVCKLKMSARLTEGYTRIDLQHLLGVGARRLDQWLARSWIHIKANRVTEKSVIQFLRSHPREYELSRIDEAWFKGLLFPAFNKVEDARSKTSWTSSGMDNGEYRFVQQGGGDDIETIQL